MNCPRCGAPAVELAFSVECSRPGCVLYAKPVVADAPLDPATLPKPNGGVIGAPAITSAHLRALAAELLHGHAPRWVFGPGRRMEYRAGATVLGSVDIDPACGRWHAEAPPGTPIGSKPDTLQNGAILAEEVERVWRQVQAV